MQWAFDDSRNLAVITLRSIISGATPILCVSHDSDGSWQFLSIAVPKEEDAVIVSLAEIATCDPTVHEVAPLPHGWCARRGSVNATWVCSPNYGSPEAQREAIRRDIDVHDRQGRPRKAAQAVLDLALAQSDAGHQDEALASYCDAVDRADRLGDFVLQAEVRRDYGLLLADLDQGQEAEKQLRLAVVFASFVRDEETLGHAQVAQGVFLLKHRCEPEAGKRLLREALQRLDADDPDAICARSHLDALKRPPSENATG
jgi:tetratricopeptide (TPR) repeat protein